MRKYLKIIWDDFVCVAKWIGFLALFIGFILVLGSPFIMVIGFKQSYWWLLAYPVVTSIYYGVDVWERANNQ